MFENVLKKLTHYAAESVLDFRLNDKHLVLLVRKCNIIIFVCFRIGPVYYITIYFLKRM